MRYRTASLVVLIFACKKNTQPNDVHVETMLLDQSTIVSKDAAISAMADAKPAPLLDENVCSKVFTSPAGATDLRCENFPGGAWAVEPDSVGRRDCRSLAAYWGATRFVLMCDPNGEHRECGDAGRRPACVAEQFVQRSVDSDNENWVREVSDYDGDGVPELLRFGKSVGERNYQVFGELYKLRNGELVTFALPPGLGKVFDSIDADGDGRDDLVCDARAHVDWIRKQDSETQPVIGFDEPVRFLAHSLLDGSFSLNDQVAKEYARGWCPSAPAMFIKQEPPTSDLRQTDPAFCARLWATPATLASIRSKIQATCGAGLPITEGREVCRELLETFDQEPPLHLP